VLVEPFLARFVVVRADGEDRIDTTRLGVFGDIDRFMSGVRTSTGEDFSRGALAHIDGDLDATFVLIVAECGTLSGGTDRADRIDAVGNLAADKVGVGRLVESAVFKRCDQCGGRSGDVVIHRFSSVSEWWPSRGQSIDWPRCGSFRVLFYPNLPHSSVADRDHPGQGSHRRGRLVRRSSQGDGQILAW